MKPDYRSVEFIGYRKGVRGGGVWVLVLSCGHIEYRSMRRFTLDDPRIFRTPKLAPKRVLCTSCRLGCEPCPELVQSRAEMVSLAAPISNIDARDSSR